MDLIIYILLQSPLSMMSGWPAIRRRRTTTSRSLTGIEGYRLRIGDWRVVYTLKYDVLTVVVIRVGHRREIYE